MNEGGGGTSSILALDDTKAGMVGLDKEKIENTINELSKGSPFYENEKRKAEIRQKKIDQMLRKAEEFDNMKDTFQIRRKVDQLVADNEACRTFRNYCHLDMDMFFAAVEEKYDPSLKDKPMAVGGLAMLSTSNYHARKYGVRAAMPGYIAKKLCPELVIVGSHFNYYKEEAAVVRGIVEKYDPNYSSAGLDELCMCLDEYLEHENTKGRVLKREEKEKEIAILEQEVERHQEQQQQQLGRQSEAFEEETTPQKLLEAARSEYEALKEPLTAPQVIEEIRQKIVDATSLTASAGLAPTAALSKICSNFNKPNGQYVLDVKDREEVLHFMKTMSVRKVNGVGKVQELFLSALGIKTCGEIYDNRYKLCHVLTEKCFQFLLSVSLGTMGAFSAFKVQEDDESGRKSVSSDTTITTIGSTDHLVSIIRERLVTAHETIVEEALIAKQVTLKLKQKSYRVNQFSKQLPRPTDDIEKLWGVCEQLLAPHLQEYKDLRLVGVRLGMLTEKTESSQRTLDDMFAAQKKKKREEEPATVDNGGRGAGLAAKVKKFEGGNDQSMVVLLSEVDDDSASSDVELLHEPHQAVTNAKQPRGNLRTYSNQTVVDVDEATSSAVSARSKHQSSSHVRNAVKGGRRLSKHSRMQRGDNDDDDSRDVVVIVDSSASAEPTAATCSGHSVTILD